MLDAYVWSQRPPLALLEKIPYEAAVAPSLKYVEVAERYEPEKLCIAMRPVPSPPFHQSSLPALPAPLRKLQAVRLSTLTPSTFQTTMPLRPSGLPPSPLTPKSWSESLLLHCGAPGLVPSTTTRLRSMPRRWMPGVAMMSAAGVL